MIKMKQIRFASHCGCHRLMRDMKTKSLGKYSLKVLHINRTLTDLGEGGMRYSCWRHSSCYDDCHTQTLGSSARLSLLAQTFNVGLMRPVGVQALL